MPLAQGFEWCAPSSWSPRNFVVLRTQCAALILSFLVWPDHVQGPFLVIVARRGTPFQYDYDHEQEQWRQHVTRSLRSQCFREISISTWCCRPWAYAGPYMILAWFQHAVPPYPTLLLTPSPQEATTCCIASRTDIPAFPISNAELLICTGDVPDLRHGGTSSWSHKLGIEPN